MEFVPTNDGAHKVIVSPEMRNSVCDAYHIYQARKKNEELAAAELAPKKED